MTKKEEFYLLENAVENFTDKEKDFEKLKRERNILKKEKTFLIKKVQKKEKVLETIEMYLIQRIEKLKESNVSKTAIYELELLLNGLLEEKKNN